MIVHIIGDKGVVGSATKKVLERSGMHKVTGNDVGEPVRGVGRRDPRRVRRH